MKKDVDNAKDVHTKTTIVTSNYKNWYFFDRPSKDISYTLYNSINKVFKK